MNKIIAGFTTLGLLVATAGTSAVAQGRSPVWAPDRDAMTLTVPSGTPLEIELVRAVNTKKAKVGDRVEGRLVNTVVVDEWRAVESGARVRGTVTDVHSGGNKVGGTPRLKISFDSLVAENGESVPINARYKKEGNSESGQDAAKILGGAAAGAVVGHQVDEDQGTIIGGLVGGAAGAAAAKNTGGDLKLEKGTVLRVRTESAFRVGR